MKILVLSNIYPPVVRGGYEVECAGVVELLRARGDEVVVLTSRSENAREVEPGVVRELHLRDSSQRSILLAPIRTLRDRRATTALVEAFRPDLAFVWNGAHLSHATIADLLASGTPTAFRICEHWFGTLYTDDYYLRYLVGGGSARRRLWSGVIRALNALPGFRLSPSVPAEVALSWVSEFLRRAVPTPDGLVAQVERVIHPTTRHAALFDAVERRPSEEALLAFVGRLSPEKGADVAIEALSHVVKRGHDARLVLAGDGSGEDRARLDSVAVQAGVVDRCTFAGKLEVTAVCELLATARVLVLPSVWQEPLPITLIEGALARVPIVASRVGGIPEALRDGEEGILTAPGDPRALAEGVMAVLDDPAAASARVRRAHVRAQKLSWEAYAEATRGFIDDAYQALSLDAGADRP